MKTFSDNPKSRRNFLATGFAAGLACVLPALPAHAFSLEEARALIDRAVGDINKIINSGKSEAAMLREFEGIFERYADGNVIGQLVLGADGRSASDAQKRKFDDAFQIYISRKYGRRFREFVGGKIIVGGARTVKSFYEVTTTAHLTGETPFVVEFVVADRNGRFIDMKIEGISLIKAERAEIGAMLDKRRGNLDQLIEDLAKAS